LYRLPYLLVEGAYFAPELGNVYTRRGGDNGGIAFIKNWIKIQPLKVYASVLKAHLASIAYLKNAHHSKLVVTDGRLVSSYYATINSMQVDSLISALETQALRDDLMLKVQAKSFYEPEPPDVLSDMSEGGQFHIWQFDLPDVVLPEFRGAALRYGLSLRFNSLGLAQLHFETDLAGVDVNHIRHLINLPLENALDEKINWQEKAGLLYLRDVADYLFSQIDDWWYYGLDHGQHVSFYGLETLRYLAGQFGLNFTSDGSGLHMFSTKPVNSRLFRFVANKFSASVISSTLKRRSLLETDFEKICRRETRDESRP